MKGELFIEIVDELKLLFKIFDIVNLIEYCINKLEFLIIRLFLGIDYLLY